MSLFGGLIPIKGVAFLMFSLLMIITLGYLLGRISVKGVSLGTAGVFIAALVYGCIFYPFLSEQLSLEGVSFVSNGLKIIENLGLIMFVTAIGFIAGPKFFGNFVRNFKSYILLGIVIILSGGLVCVLCLFIESSHTTLSPSELSSMMAGLLAGALTSTPAFSAAKEAAVAEGGSALEASVSVGYGIAYLFGVVGVVLFVQVIPRLLKADMSIEREYLTENDKKSAKKPFGGKLISLDSFGIMPFALAGTIGLFLGSIKVGNFSLTTTGGCLLTSLVLGHFSKITLRKEQENSPQKGLAVSIMPSERTLKVFRELGLVLFLTGAGISGGGRFVELFEGVYFIYGVMMTLVPMIIGFLFAKYVLRLRLLNNLGSITGGMTSTPALGTLINVAGTEDVASAYAATYPIALLAVVLVSQLIILLF